VVRRKLIENQDKKNKDSPFVSGRIASKSPLLLLESYQYYHVHYELNAFLSGTAYEPKKKIKITI